MSVPKACERAARKIKRGINSGSVLICTDDFAEIIAAETHLAEVVGLLKDLIETGEGDMFGAQELLSKIESNAGDPAPRKRSKT